jgi:hypothetical protein
MIFMKLNYKPAFVMKSTKFFFTGNEKKDLEIFEMLYEIHYSCLCSMVKQIVKLEKTAELIVHEAFLSLWNDRKRISKSSNLKSYLCKEVFTRSVLILEKTADQEKTPENKELNLLTANQLLDSLNYKLLRS